MIVHGSSVSPVARKLLAYAADKGLETEVLPPGLGSKDPDFLAAIPFVKP